MRPGRLVAAGVCLLALVAGIDALHGGGRQPAPATTEAREPRPQRPSGEGPPAIPGRSALARRLRANGLTGLLILTDERCVLRALALPTLVWLARPSERPTQCMFSRSPGGSVDFRGEAVALAPNGRLTAICRGGGVEVFAEARRPRSTIAGACAPAWRPDGRLTVAKGASVVGCRDAARCTEPVLSARTLLSALRRSGRLPRGLHDLRIEQLAWLTDSRLALVASYSYFAGRDGVVAVFDGGRLVAPPTAHDRFANLGVSPRRTTFVARGRGPRGLYFFDRDGRLLAANPVAGGHHAAWSPDDRWTAVATGGSTYLFRTADLARVGRGGRLPLIRLPFYAADLAWIGRPRPRG